MKKMFLHRLCAFLLILPGLGLSITIMRQSLRILGNKRPEMCAIFPRAVCATFCLSAAYMAIQVHPELFKEDPFEIAFVFAFIGLALGLFAPLGALVIAIILDVSSQDTNKK